MAQVQLIKIGSAVTLTGVANASDSARLYSLGLGVNADTGSPGSLLLADAATSLAHIDLKDPDNWDIDDEWDFGALLPATTATPNPGNTGNCNLVDLGGYHAIVPAAGDGTHDVDLATAVPVPQAGGGWDYNYNTDTLSFPSDPTDTKFALLDVPIMPYVQIGVNVPWSPMGVFDFDAYDCVPISRRWKLRFAVRKSSSGPGKLAGWIVGFRDQNT